MNNNNNLLSKQELEALLKPGSKGLENERQDLKLQTVLDFPLEIAVRLGDTTRTIEELMKLIPGAVIELDREIDQPADLIVNGHVVARGEIVIIEENFGVRITSILNPEERIEQLRQGNRNGAAQPYGKRDDRRSGEYLPRAAASALSAILNRRVYITTPRLEMRAVNQV